jgi:hypothetical protein
MPRTARPLTVAALVAVLIAVAAGTGATAASLITGAQIKDGTVTGADVKNGSLRSADMAGGAYTKAQTDKKFATNGWMTVPAASFQVEAGAADIFRGADACVRASSAATLVAGVPLPTGVTITAIRATVIDTVFPANNVVTLKKRSGAQVESLATIDQAPATTQYSVVSQQLAVPETVSADEYVWLEYSNHNTGLLICGASVQYRLPGGSGVRSAL